MAVEPRFKDLLSGRASVDSSDMLGLLEAFPEQMALAWKIGDAFVSRLAEKSASRIVVCGMGGSAIGGDLVRSYLGNNLRVPLHVNRGYSIPESAVDGAFFVFSSYSGNTGETLAAYDQVRGMTAGAVAITSGGELEARARQDGIPVCSIPGGMPPRAAIAYSFFPLLRVLDHIGLATIPAGEFEAAAPIVSETCARFVSDTSDNEAAELALRIKGKLPFVYSCGGLFEAVARRWSCQFNENGKTLAHYATFTESNHNEIVGWKALEKVRSSIALISLEDEEDHEMARNQRDVALEIIKPLAGDVIRKANFKGGRMVRMLCAMLLGDFASVYTAYINNLDPTPVLNIDFLKKRLKN